MVLPVRRSPRLADFDYATPGWYFVTTVTADRRRLLAVVRDGGLCLTPAGEIVEAAWQRIPLLNPGVVLDRFVVMPNHVHGIVHLGAGTRDEARDGRLTTIVGSFKGVASREIRASNPRIGKIWQRSFHEWVIRSDTALERIRRYVERNPERWVAEHSQRKAFWLPGTAGGKR